jgi:hypothetical protein
MGKIRDLAAARIAIPCGDRETHHGYSVGKESFSLAVRVDFFLSLGFLRFFKQTGVITRLGVFSNAFLSHKKRVHLITALGILVTLVVTSPTLLDFSDQMGSGMSNVARRSSLGQTFVLCYQ